MNKNVLWGIILILLITNGLTLTLWKKEQTEAIGTSSLTSEVKGEGSNEIIARVGNRDILQDDLVHRLESLHGSEVLENMINYEVVFQMAEKEKINITAEEIEREVEFLKSMSSDQLDSFFIGKEEEWKNEINYLLLLEELITKDIVISDEQLRAFYNENEQLYNLPASFHLAHIVVGSLGEAKTVIDELESGSSFSALAMERSEDVFSASQGGDLGFIKEDNDFVPAEYVQEAKKLEVGNWSQQPIKTNDGFAIILLKNVINEKSYSFKEVKDEIRRQMAFQQLESQVTPKAFWSEIGVEIFKENN